MRRPGRLATAVAAVVALVSVVWLALPDDSSAAVEGAERTNGGEGAEVVAQPPSAQVEPDVAAQREALADESESAAPERTEPGPPPSKLLRYEQERIEIRALVLDEDRRPLEGAVATVMSLRGQPSATAGADGRIALVVDDVEPVGWPEESMPVKTGIAHVYVHAAGRSSHVARGQLLAGRHLDLGTVVLSPAGSLEGRVVAPAGGPVVAHVALGPPIPEIPDEMFAQLRHGTIFDEPVNGRRWMSTDSAGQYRIDGVAVGEYSIWAWGDETQTTWSEPVRVVAGGHVLVDDLLLVALDEDSSIRGEVVDGRGEPVAGAWVHGHQYADESRDAFGPEAIRLTRSDGTFVLPARPGAEVQVTCMDAAKVVVRAGTRDLVLRLGTAPDAETRGLNGVVLRDGAPVPGVRVEARSTVVETDAQGRFDLPLRWGGSVTVRAEARLDGALWLACTGKFPLGSNPEALVLELAHAGGLRGRVLAADTTPWTGTPVVAVLQELSVERRASVGRDGAWEIPDVLPGTWTVALGDEQLPSDDEQQQQADVSPGQWATIELDRRGAPACILKGRLRLGGRPPSGVWQWNLRAKEYSVWMKRLGGDGRFDAQLDEAGTYTWEASSNGISGALMGLQSEIGLAPGDNDVDIDLPAGTLVLEGLDLPEAIDPQVLEVHYMLYWKRRDGLQWYASLLFSKGGTIRIDQAPAGKVSFFAKQEGSITWVDLLEGTPAMEIDVRAGRETVVTVPQ